MCSQIKIQMEIMKLKTLIFFKFHSTLMLSPIVVKMYILQAIQENPDHEYLIISNQGWLTFPSNSYHSLLWIMYVMYLLYWVQQKMFLIISQNWLREMLLNKGRVSKKWGVDFFRCWVRGDWGFSESDFQLFIKYHIR